MLKLILIGNLTKDPELRVVNTENGQRSVTSFTVAVNGRRENDTTFIRLSVWDTLAENCAKYLSKGRKVCCVCSNVSARTYQATDGTSRISIEATANEVEFLSSGQQSDAENTAPRSQRTAPSQAPAPVRTEQTQMTPVEFDDGELPF